MPFNVNFYTFSKKQRSTAVPSGTGETVSCHANQTLDVLAPEITLDWRQESGLPTVYNYARISDFGRWYWITGWKNDGGIWSASLQVDVLASWKTQIGANSCYIFRSSAAYNTSLTDSLYPITTQLERYDTSLSKIWTVGGANAAGAAAGSGTYVLGILSNGWAGLPGVQYYGFTAAELSTFMDYIFSDAYFNHVLSEFGATEYPEAKVAINPLQYVTSARFYPLGYSGTGSGDYVLHGAGTTFVAIGSQTITDSQVWAAAFYDIPNTQQHFRVTRQTWTLVPVEGWYHSQSAARGDWLNKAPYSRVELFFPPYGLIELNPADVIGATLVAIHLDIDVWTGTGTLTIEVTRGAITRVVSRLSTQVGLDIPLSNVYYNGIKEQGIWNASWKAITSTISGNLAGVREGFVDAYKTVVDSGIPHLCTFGTQNGSVAPMGGTPKLMFTHQLMASDDNPDMGRPYCSVRTISEIPGYIQADSDELSVPCTDPELAEIREAVSSGFWYE